MRWLLIGLGCAALAGCNKREQSEPSRPQSSMAAASVAEDRAAGAPGVDVTAAPGVAFTYNYGFRLPSDAISTIQEEHAQACEKLGVARCRITGVRYRLLGEHNIEGELDLKLAPELARGFGKTGTTVVERAHGTLVDLEVSGTDTQPVTQQAGTLRARAVAELKRLDAVIAAARAGTERAELQQQRAEIARQLEAAQDTASEARESLASTPVTFRYESGPAIQGFDTSAPFTSAINTGIASVETTLAVVLAIVAIFGPPALVAGLVVWVVIAFRRRRRETQPGTVTAPPAD